MNDLDSFLASEQRTRHYLRKPLVSPLYRLSPPEGVTVTKDRAEERLRATMRRLVRQFGVGVVCDRIRKSDGNEYMKAWLVLTAEAENVRAKGLP